jgi:hypothetical protein
MAVTTVRIVILIGQINVYVSTLTPKPSNNSDISDEK